MQSAQIASNLMGTMAVLQFIAVIGMIPLCIRMGPAPAYRLVVILLPPQPSPMQAYGMPV